MTKERIGRRIWANIDGVAKNVMPVLNALKADSATGVRTVAHDEWLRYLDRFQALQQLLANLESKAVEYSHDQIIGRLQAFLGYGSPSRS